LTSIPGYASMKINVADLRDNASMAISFDETIILPDEYLLTDRVVFLSFAGNICKKNNLYILNLEAKGRLSAECDFCLIQVKQPIVFTVSEIFSGYESDDEDIWVFHGDTIDIFEAVRMNMLLNFPSSFICKAGCKGLCPKCGRNLNEKDCGCQPDPDPRFDILKELRR